MAQFSMNITDKAFSNSPLDDVQHDDQITLTWLGEGDSVVVQTANSDEPERGVQLFKEGTDYSYTVKATGSTFTVKDVPLGSEWFIYLQTLGASVKGTVNIKKRPGDGKPQP